MQFPETFVADAQRCLIPVPAEEVDRLRNTIGGTEDRERRFRHITPEFEGVAEAIYGDLGSPTITMNNAWEVYEQMIPLVIQFYNS